MKNHHIPLNERIIFALDVADPENALILLGPVRNLPPLFDSLLT